MARTQEIFDVEKTKLNFTVLSNITLEMEVVWSEESHRPLLGPAEMMEVTR